MTQKYEVDSDDLQVKDSWRAYMSRMASNDSINRSIVGIIHYYCSTNGLS